MSRFTTTLTALALAAVLLSAAHAEDKLKFKIIGQPLATGLIQKNKEQPFFENFAARTGLPIDAEYKPIDTLGIKDTEQLRVMKA
jgi:TRAP-type C4-dicarboxylate transport system substrate-binding protein